MDHESARACFTGYHDGELAESDRLALEEHLAACADCSSEWDAYRRAVEEVSGLRTLAPSEDFARQVTLAIELRDARRRHFGGLSLTGIRIAVLSLVLIMLFVMAYLTYLLLFSVPEPKPPAVPATKHTHGDVEVIGPIRIEPPPPPEETP